MDQPLYSNITYSGGGANELKKISASKILIQPGSEMSKIGRETTEEHQEIHLNSYLSGGGAGGGAGGTRQQMSLKQDASNIYLSHVVRESDIAEYGSSKNDSYLPKFVRCL